MVNNEMAVNATETVSSRWAIKMKLGHVSWEIGTLAWGA